MAARSTKCRTLGHLRTPSKLAVVKMFNININTMSSRSFPSFNQRPNSALVHLPTTFSTRPPFSKKNHHTLILCPRILERTTTVTLFITHIVAKVSSMPIQGCHLFESGMHSSPRICHPPPAIFLVNHLSM